MIFLLEGLEPQRVQEIFDKIKDGKIDEAVTAHTETLVVLMNEIERQAEAQGLIGESEVASED